MPKKISNEEALARLVELDEIQRKIEEDNLIEYFDKPPYPGPNPLQVELLDAWLDAFFKVFTYTGANRIGKTTIGVIIAICTLAGKYIWNNQRLHFPHSKPKKVRYIGQDWEKHIKAVLIPDLKKWWPKNRPVKTKKNNQGVEALWTDERTGSSLEIMSNLQESDLHEGWNGDLVIYDEPPKRDIRVANARGLIDRHGRELFCMTLLKEAWVDREVIKARLEDGRPDPTVFNVTGDIYSNVGFGITVEGVDQFAKLLTEDEKQARLKGIPSYMSGLVYPDFKRKIHLKDRDQVPLDWPVDIGIDIHPREKQAVLFCATDRWGRKWLVDEIWDHGDGVWVAEEIIRHIKYHSYRVNRIIIDPLAKGDSNNNDTVYDKIALLLMRYGYVLETASKDKSSGILDVKKCLLGPNKEPSLFIYNDLIRTLMEIEGYMYDEDTQKPKDKDDHMMENLYRIVLLDTQYTPYEDDLEEDEEGKFSDNRSSVTGY